MSVLAGCSRPPPARGSRLLPLFFFLGAAACTDAGSAPSLATRTDSAGIEVVRHEADLFDRLPAWRLSDVPRMDIGVVEGEEPYRFYRVSGASVLAGDTTVVVNGGTQELRFFDGEGRFIRRVAGEGDGPGEFRVPFGVWQVGDSLAVWDARLQRLSIFDRSGEFLRVATPERPGLNRRVVGVFRDGTVVTEDPWFDIGDGFTPMYLRFARFGPDGEFRDSLPQQPYGLMGRLGESGLIGGPLFEARTRTAAGARSYWVGRGEEPELLRLDPSGRLTQVVRWPDEEREVSQSDVDAYWSDRLEGTEGDRRRQVEILQESMPVAERFPVLDELHATREGGLWIRRYEPLGTSGPREWLVLDSTGAMVATIETPETFRVLEIGEDYVAGVRTDELDVEHFTIYELGKGNGSSGG